MIALSTLALAAAGCTITPPSIAVQTLCTRILPVARSSEISTAPAPGDRRPAFGRGFLAGRGVEGFCARARAERARTLRDRDADGAAVGPFCLVVGHLRQRLEHLARLGRGAHALEPEFDRIDALV